MKKIKLFSKMEQRKSTRLVQKKSDKDLRAHE